LAATPSVVIEGLVTQSADEPGLAVSLIRGGSVAARHCVGLASLTHRIPIGAGTRFHIVSVSKTFAAAAVLVLAARGALGLDDDVRRHLPELPAEIGRHGTVTIRHLLSMTSGLRDVLEIERLRGVWTATESRERDLLDLALRQRSVSAPAGSQYMYANVNAVLLEALIERASGMPAEVFRRETFYEPLGLTSTAARPHEGIVLPDLAEPYVPDGLGGWTRPMNLLGVAADPLTTSIDDLSRWVLALRSGTIAGVDVRSAMAERTRLRDGRPVYYGLGLAVRRYRGLTVLCHTGSQPGSKAHIAYAPERDVGLAILSNREDTSVTALAAALIDGVIGEGFPTSHPARRSPRPASVSATAAPSSSAIAGTCVDLETGEWVRLGIEDGVLRGDTLGDSFFLYQDGDGVFRDGDDYRATVPVELRLGSGPDGVIGRLNLGGQSITLRTCDPPRYTPEALAGFAGTYESREMASRHHVRLENGGLVIDYGFGDEGGLRFSMEPIARDAFLVQPTAPGIAYRHVFRFERDAAGRVVGAVVTMERLKNARLARVADAPPEMAPIDRRPPP
jgi:CubicO group peptidase (beta-lactamase class C family)